MKTKLLGVFALSVAVVLSTSAAYAVDAKTAKPTPSAEACTGAKTVVEKHDLGCKLTKAEKKELKAAKKAAKTAK